MTLTRKQARQVRNKTLYALMRDWVDAGAYGRCVRVDFFFNARLRKHRFAAVGMIRGTREVIVSTQSGATPELAIRNLLLEGIRIDGFKKSTSGARQ